MKEETKKKKDVCDVCEKVVIFVIRFLVLSFLLFLMYGAWSLGSSFL